MEDVVAHLYNKIYIVLVLILTFRSLSQYKVTNGKCILEKNTLSSTNAICFFMIFFIGFRPISHVFVDMLDYAYAMLDHRYEKIEDANYIFTPFMGFLSSIGCPPRGSIFILALINFFASYVAIKKIFLHNVQIAFVFFLGCFSTFMYATNGIKAGCAEAILLCAIVYRERLIISIPLLFLALGIHHSQMIMVAAYVLAFFYRNPKHYLLGWIACLVVSVLHIQYFQHLFTLFTDEHGADYLTISEDDDFYVGSGFRPDFVLYSALPIIIGWYYMLKRKFKDKIYTFVFNTYLVGNSVWLLCMYANYSYRFAYLSWGLYPILVLYPFLKLENNFSVKINRYFKYIIVLNVLLTFYYYFSKY